MDFVKLTCPNCRKKFMISTEELDKKYKHGYVPIFCNYKCELRFSNK
ncbi:MAG: hypothetical protein IJ675_02260 [Pseudobutyrivibrio sp.]|nr:hypothetical protein [Pseudobutyrivibrio sp.]